MAADFEQKCKDLYRVRLTLNEMLEDRGVDMTAVNTAIGYSQWCGLVEEYVGDVPALDIQVAGAKKVYVRFMEKFKLTEARTTYETIMRMMGMDRAVDDVIMVVTGSAAARNEMASLEASCVNLTVFHYRDLLFNVSRHILVPRHNIVKTPEEKAHIMRDYQITSDLQFPVLERKDPQARYLGARKGALVKIERPSIGGLCHAVYRIVI
jgi:DNA-directed RNA polymerases I, II, and III subunit RPABC1